MSKPWLMNCLLTLSFLLYPGVASHAAPNPAPTPIVKTAGGTTFRLQYQRHLNGSNPILTLQVLNPGTPRPLAPFQLLVELRGSGIFMPVNVESIQPGLYRLKTRLPGRGNWVLVVTQLAPPRKEVRFQISTN